MGEREVSTPVRAEPVEAQVHPTTGFTSSGDPTLFDYPAASHFGRPLPKNKLYEKGGLKGKQKALFVRQVEQIVWQNKLAAETINLPSGQGIQEIQVFAISLKGNGLDDEVLRCIDRAIPFPLIFELHRVLPGAEGRRQVQMVAAHKQLVALDGSPQPRWQMSGYFAGPWLPADTPRRPLPLALDLAGLYEQMLKPLLPLATRAGEGLHQLIVRAEQIAQKQREVAQVARRLGQEKQFKRKVPLNAHLRQLKVELEQLSR